MDTIINILIVVALFNVIIFVHELGHFLAARWRGLRVDRFQIWFGKPIWKKEINGVQYGLGWIPAGGFVALPQMAPMEAVEGANRDTDEPLAPVKPMDKIIVAFAGPLFSFGLALFAAVLVTWVGKPKDFVESTVIGYVPEEGVAAKAGLQVGDKIVEVNGQKVSGFLGSPSFDSVQEAIMLSEGDEIEIKVERDGEIIPITTNFDIPETRWWERRGLRTLGIWVENETKFAHISEGGPADKAGLEVGDKVVAVDGEPLRSRDRFSELVEKGKPLELTIERGDETLVKTLTPLTPTNLEGEMARPMIGVGFGRSGEYSRTIYHPSPLEQVGDSVRMMWVTLAKIASPKSDVSIQHLSGPVGIGGVMFDMLGIKDGWRRLLWFMVLFNVNLAILNMLPFPILDGGHIVLAIGEMLAGKPVRAPLLDFVQYAFFFLLIGLFLFITTKDIGDRLGIGGGQGPIELQWPEEAGT